MLNYNVPQCAVLHCSTDHMLHLSFCSTVTLHSPHLVCCLAFYVLFQSLSPAFLHFIFVPRRSGMKITVFIKTTIIYGLLSDKLDQMCFSKVQSFLIIYYSSSHLFTITLDTVHWKFSTDDYERRSLVVNKSGYHDFYFLLI